MKNTPARLWIIPAKEAPIALVIRRKPHKVWHFLSWDLENGRVESGDWTWGIFYPKGCDISWDGRLWTYHGDFGDEGGGLARSPVSPPWRRGTATARGTEAASSSRRRASCARHPGSKGSFRASSARRSTTPSG